MKIVRSLLLILFGYTLLTAEPGNSQIWVGSDDFQGSQINTSLWTTNVASIQNATVYVNNGLKYSSTSEITEENAYLTWANLLPKNDNWTIYADGFVNKNATQNSNQKLSVSLYLSSYFQAIGDSDYINNRQMFGIKIISDVQGTKFTAASSSNATAGSWTLFKSPFISNQNGAFALNYSSSDNTLSAWYNPTDNIKDLNKMLKLAEVNIQDWKIQNNSASYYAILGGQSESVQTFGLDAYATSFIVIPEPSALSLLAVGLGGWAMMRRRRS